MSHDLRDGKQELIAFSDVKPKQTTPETALLRAPT